MKTYRGILSLALLVALPTSYGVYNISQPEHYPMKFFRGEVTKASETVLFGPYPTEKEIKYLKRLGVKEIISLMDPSMPFESSLIERGKQLAEKHKLAFQNVPLSYLPNLHSKENLARVGDLVSSIGNNSNKKYIHCYLGQHRTTLVKEHYVQVIEVSL